MHLFQYDFNSKEYEEIKHLTSSISDCHRSITNGFASLGEKKEENKVTLNSMEEPIRDLQKFAGDCREPLAKFLNGLQKELTTD